MLRWVLILLAVAIAIPALATSNRCYLAGQYDWSANRGFYLDLENEAPGSEPCRLATLTMHLGIADGQGWRFVSVTGHAWQLDHEYVARGVIAPGHIELSLDGKPVGRSEGKPIAPQAGPVTAGDTPGWANGRAEYIVVQSRLLLTSGRRRLALQPAVRVEQVVPLRLFEPGFFGWLGKSAPWETRPDETMTVEVAFRLVAYPDLRAAAPFVDRYGQCRYGDWPGKIKTDADLRAAQAREERQLAAWGEPPGYDRYGGYRQAGWAEKGTGFYRVTKRAGQWWLVTPEGNPCFYVGLCSMPAITWSQTPCPPERQYLFERLPARTGEEASAWGENPWGADPGVPYFAPHTPNLIRKWGADWRAEAERLSGRRLRAWGFSGVGKWGGMAGFGVTPVLSRAGAPNLVRRPDFLDDTAAAQFRQVLAKQVAPRRDDPFVLGWTVGSEYDEIVTKDEIRQILAKGSEVASKRALVDYAVNELYTGDIAKLAAAWQVPPADLYASAPRPPTADLERLRQWYADRYYDFCYRAVKAADPNHLYLGCYVVPGWWESTADWGLIARRCDVMSYDLYSNDFAGPWLDKLIREADKPIFCGEFSFPSYYDGQRGFGAYPVWTHSDQDSGERYAKWLETAARHPYCVGVNWFEYRDEPVTGRGPGSGPDLVYGEHYAFGMVDNTDQPKWPLVERVRAANLKAAQWRLAAAKP